MAVAVAGTPGSATYANADTDVGNLTGNYTLDASADIILICVGWEGNENPRASDPVEWNTDGTTEVCTLVSDSGNQGSNAYTRSLVYAYVNPTTGNHSWRVRNEFSASPWVVSLIGFSGTETTSVSAATNDLETVVNTSASSTTAFSNLGTSGNGLMVWGTSQDEDAATSVNASFTEQLDFASGASGDLGGYLATLIGGPAQPTITWNDSQPNSGCYVELVAASAGGTRTDFHAANRGVMRGAGRGI